jgi:hypothetical protein
MRSDKDATTSPSLMSLKTALLELMIVGLKHQSSARQPSMMVKWWHLYQSAY